MYYNVSMNDLFYTIDYCDEATLNNYMLIKGQIDMDSKKRNWAFNQPEPVRSKLLYLTGQNSYGFRHERLFIHESGGVLVGVPPKEGRGDAKNVFTKKYYEFKVSYSSKVQTYSFWQVRLWQNLDGYVFKIIDRENDFKVSYFCLDKEQILVEGELQKPGATHGDDAVAKENKHVELTYRYNPKKFEMRDRWMSNYYKENVFEWI
jgi:hypothetical protein